MRIAILYSALLFEFLSAGIVMPMLPFVATDLGATPFGLSTLVATTGAFIFGSMICWGRMSDAVGRRPVLIATILGSGVAGALSGLAVSLPMLFVARGRWRARRAAICRSLYRPSPTSRRSATARG